MNYQELRDEILSGAKAKQCAEYVAKGADNAVADILNAQDIAQPGEITRPALLLWGAQFDVFGGLLDARDDKDSPVRSAAFAALQLLSLPDEGAASINMSDTAIAGMFQSFVKAGIVSDEAAAALQAMTPVRMTSIAETRWGQFVNDMDVAIALKNTKRNLDDEPTDYTALRSEAIATAARTAKGKK